MGRPPPGHKWFHAETASLESRAAVDRPAFLAVHDELLLGASDIIAMVGTTAVQPAHTMAEILAQRKLSHATLPLSERSVEIDRCVRGLDADRHQCHGLDRLCQRT